MVIIIQSKKFGQQELICDDSDYELILSTNPFPYKRPDNKTLYAHGRLNGKTVAIHRLIMGVTDRQKHVDHIDGNGLNNKKSNLRQCTPAQNIMNSQVSKNNKLGIKGVIKMPYGKRPYRATICHHRIKYHIGCFATLEEAKKAYDSEALRRFGDFARF